MMVIQATAVEKFDHSETVCIKEQLIFYMPLAATSFLLIITHSLFNAGLARLPYPEIYLAAFAVAKSTMHFLISPEQMVRQTVTVMVDNTHSYKEVRKFVIMLVTFVTFVLAFTAFSGFGRWILQNILGVEGRVLDESITILRVLTLFPILVSYRNFLQGILIRFRMTKLVTAVTVVRIIFVAITVFMVQHLTMLPGAVIAGLMFLCAVGVEAVASFVGVKLFIGKVSDNIDIVDEKTHTRATKLTGRSILYFYLPLAITAMVHTMATPAINAGLARTDTPEIVLSSYAVAWGLGMIFLSPAMMFHQVPLNFIRYDGYCNIAAVRRFAVYSGILLSGLLALVAFTGLGYWILAYLIGTPRIINEKAVEVLRYMVVLPPVMLARECYWGILMKKHMTKFVSTGKIINLVVLTASIGSLLFVRLPNPAIMGVIAIFCGEAAEFIYLFFIAKIKNIVAESKSQDIAV